jgi:hypothetical protein
VAWSVFAAAAAAWRWHDMAGVASRLAAGGLALPSPGGALRALLAHAETVSFSALFIAACLGAGSRVISLIPRLPVGGLERSCLAAGLGWGVLSMALLGLAHAGLFHPLFLLPVLGAAAAASGLPRRPEAPAPGWRTGFTAFLIPGAPLLLLVPLMLVPPTWVDPLIYHLAVPDMMLRAHRFVVEGQSQAMFFPMASELLNAYPVMLGLDQVTPFISVVPLAAGLILAASRLLRPADGDRKAWAVSAGLFAGLALSNSSVQWLLLNGKNDLACAGFCLMGVAAPGPALSAAFFGLAGSVKYNGLAFAAFFLAWHEGTRLARLGFRWRPDRAWPFIACLPVLPMLARNLWYRGDPLWPLLSRFIPGALWDGPSQRSYAILTGARPSPLKFLGETRWLAWNSHPALALAIPFLLTSFRAVPRPALRAGAFGALSYAAYCLLVHTEYDRLTLPAFLIMCIPAAAGAARAALALPRAAAAIPAAALAFAGWSSFSIALGAVVFGPDSLGVLIGRLSPAEYYRARATTLAETRERLAGVPGLRTVLLVEDGRAYRWPGKRVMVESYWGRSVPWEMVKDAPDPGRLAIRFRQADISHVVLNFVTARFPHEYASTFRWTPRMLTVWRDFLKYHAFPALPPLHSESVNGGFHVYGIGKPRASRELFVPFLPGIRGALWEISFPWYSSGNAEGARAAAEAVARTWPDVAEFRMESAYYSWIRMDWAATRAWVEPCVKAGILGEMNRTMLADSLRAAGKYDEALVLYEAAMETYPDNVAYIRQSMVDALARKAAVLGKAGRGAEASAAANRAFAIDPENPLAMLIRASALIFGGDPDGALVQLDRAVASPRLGPGGRQSAEVMRGVIAEQKASPGRGRVFVVVNL